MEFQAKDTKTGKVETWTEWAFVSVEGNESEPSKKRLPPKDRSQFVQMVKNGQTELESPFATFGKSYYIKTDRYDNEDLQGVVKAWLLYPQTIKKLMLAIADMCITEKDPHLKDTKYDVCEGDLLSIHNFCSPFWNTSVELSKMEMGFDDTPGELVKWIWIKTLRAKNEEKYRVLIGHLWEYYNCGA